MATLNLSNTSLAAMALLNVLLLAGAYFLGAQQPKSSGARFVPANGFSNGFMFDNKTAQVCWAAQPEGNPSHPPVPVCKELL
jgi:hypothetical protein